eukprot:3379673-Pyramimonas_sp.AAC.1
MSPAAPLTLGSVAPARPAAGGRSRPSGLLPGRGLDYHPRPLLITRWRNAAHRLRGRPHLLGPSLPV